MTETVIGHIFFGVLSDMKYVMLISAVLAAFFGGFIRTRCKTDFISSMSGKHVFITGKHVFITGASSGIGFALAKSILSEGGSVTLVGRSSFNLNKAVHILLKELSYSAEKILVKIADVGDYAQIAAAVDEAFTWRPIDVLICNAGLTRSGYLDKVTPTDLELVIRTNILGAIYPVHSALPLVKQRSPDHHMAIVFIGSLASLFLMYGNAAYTGSKHALKGIAEALRMELVPFTIRVNLICPGFVATQFLDEAEKKDELQTLMKHVNLYYRSLAHSPDYVAECTVKAVKQGTFITTTTKVLGPALLLCGRGYMPGESLVEFLLEALFYIPVKLVYLLTKYRFYRKILAFHKEHPF